MSPWRMGAGHGGRAVARMAIAMLAAAAMAPLPAAPPAPVVVQGDLAALRGAIRGGGEGPILVNFWATWCAPCVREIPLLNDLHARLAPQGVRFLAVSLDPFVYQDLAEARRKVSSLVAERGLLLPVFLYVGGQESLSQTYDLPPGLPCTLLLGADGKVLERVEGQLEPSELERLEKAARAAVAPE